MKKTCCCRSLPGKSEVIELGYLYYFNMSLSQFARGQGAREVKVGFFNHFPASFPGLSTLPQ